LVLSLLQTLEEALAIQQEQEAAVQPAACEAAAKAAAAAAEAAAAAARAAQEALDSAAAAAKLKEEEDAVGTPAVKQEEQHQQWGSHADAAADEPLGAGFEASGGAVGVREGGEVLAMIKEEPLVEQQACGAEGDDHQNDYNDDDAGNASSQQQHHDSQAAPEGLAKAAAGAAGPKDMASAVAVAAMSPNAAAAAVAVAGSPGSSSPSVDARQVDQQQQQQPFKELLLQPLKENGICSSHAGAGAAASPVRRICCLDTATAGSNQLQEVEDKGLMGLLAEAAAGGAVCNGVIEADEPAVVEEKRVEAAGLEGLGLVGKGECTSSDGKPALVNGRIPTGTAGLEQHHQQEAAELLASAFGHCADAAPLEGQQQQQLQQKRDQQQDLDKQMVDEDDGKEKHGIDGGELGSQAGAEELSLEELAALDLLDGAGGRPKRKLRSQSKVEQQQRKEEEDLEEAAFVLTEVAKEAVVLPDEPVFEGPHYMEVVVQQEGGEEDLGTEEMEEESEDDGDYGTGASKRRRSISALLAGGSQESVAAHKGRLLKNCEQWVASARKLLAEGGVKLVDVDVLLTEAQQYLWGPVACTEARQLEQQLQDAKRWAAEVTACSKAKATLAKVEELLAWVPPPVSASGLGKLREAAKAAKAWKVKYYNLQGQPVAVAPVTAAAAGLASMMPEGSEDNTSAAALSADATTATAAAAVACTAVASACGSRAGSPAVDRGFKRDRSSSLGALAAAGAAAAAASAAAGGCLGVVSGAAPGVVLELRVLNSLVSEGGRLGLELPELKACQDKLEAAKALVQTIRTVLAATGER
jgi:hypothetical protein